MTSHIYQPFGVRSSSHPQRIALQILVYFWQIVQETVLLLLAAVRTHRQKNCLTFYSTLHTLADLACPSMT